MLTDILRTHSIKCLNDSYMTLSYSLARRDGRSILTAFHHICQHQTGRETLAADAARRFIAQLTCSSSSSSTTTCVINDATLGGGSVSDGHPASVTDMRELDEYMRQIAWSRVLLQQQLAAFDDKLVRAKIQLQVWRHPSSPPQQHSSTNSNCRVNAYLRSLKQRHLRRAHNRTM